MNQPTKLSLCAAACALVTACGSVPRKTFTFDAITLEERPHPCLIVVDDEWDAAAENQQVVNMNGDDELQLTLEFKRAEVEITVAPLAPGSNVMPRSRSEALQMSQFQDDMPRRLRLDDPSKHLFILTPK